ncbi:MAG: (Fe-S)-binding protein [Deltaproteobacteria bacterium]|jgi:glycolate oxidase iron-sulfur subunit|nr:(Fe-S)-binding protein [Deltaproteobacteria bacterium]
MAKLKNLQDLRNEIEMCVKCGACRAHCPVFGVEKHEGRVARGKVALAHAVLDQTIDFEPKMIEDISQCLLCGSCYAQCPNKVPTDEIIAATRRQIAADHGLNSFGKGVAALLGRPRLMNNLAKAGRFLSPLFFKKLPENSGLRLRFPAPWIEADRTLPPIASKPFRDTVPEFIAGDPNMPTVAFFSGCGINYMYPAIGEAFLKVLKFLGVNVFIPKEQACCGLPAVSAGAQATVEQLALQNLSALSAQRVDFVVTACASCHSGIGKLYSDLGTDYQTLAAKTRDIFVFLVEHGLPEKLSSLPATGKRTRVTYHDPCHLRSHGIVSEPRQILQAIPNIDFVEMAEAGTCCGLGGTYSVHHYQTSKKIGAKKAAHILASGADLVATNCPGCIMQLQDSINHAQGRQRSVHILELLVAALE